MIDLSSLEVWFLTGSQHLYGDDVLKTVAAHSQEIARYLNDASEIPVRVVFKPVLTGADGIREVCREANAAENCIGVVCWMHTFSPAKMWIAGLLSLQKPMAHLHTQYNRELPWSTIDMDFMNLNQAAHGDREFGFIGTRLQRNRKVIVGFWQDAGVLAKLGVWTRAAAAWWDSQRLKIARFGDNMREVAVTEGDKVSAQARFGYSVNGYGTGDLVAEVNGASEGAVDGLVGEYLDAYEMAEDLKPGGARHGSVRDAARIEAGLRAFLEKGGFGAFTDTFQDLHGLKQLPGLAVQRLMAEGYGFGAEGDWKTAALVRAMKVMAQGLGGVSFMEDYTYHLVDGGKVLGAHMLEICPSIASGKAKLEVHPLGIGGKEDPARLVFDCPSGVGLNASLIDMGNRFRMILNDVLVVDTPAMPKLPVARAVWVPKPDFETAATCWIYAGGAHHTGFTQVLTAEHLEDFSDMADVECVRIGEDTRVRSFRQELLQNDLVYTLKRSY